MSAVGQSVAGSSGEPSCHQTWECLVATEVQSEPAYYTPSEMGGPTPVAFLRRNGVGGRGGESGIQILPSSAAVVRPLLWFGL